MGQTCISYDKAFTIDVPLVAGFLGLAFDFAPLFHETLPERCPFDKFDKFAELSAQEIENSINNSLTFQS